MCDGNTLIFIPVIILIFIPVLIQLVYLFMYYWFARIAIFVLRYGLVCSWIKGTSVLNIVPPKCNVSLIFFMESQFYFMGVRMMKIDASVQSANTSHTCNITFTPNTTVNMNPREERNTHSF